MLFPRRVVSRQSAARRSESWAFSVRFTFSSLFNLSARANASRRPFSANMYFSFVTQEVHNRAAAAHEKRIAFIMVCFSLDYSLLAKLQKFLRIRKLCLHLMHKEKAAGGNTQPFPRIASKNIYFPSLVRRELIAAGSGKEGSRPYPPFRSCLPWTRLPPSIQGFRPRRLHIENKAFTQDLPTTGIVQAGYKNYWTRKRRSGKEYGRTEKMHYICSLTLIP